MVVQPRAGFAVQGGLANWESRRRTDLSCRAFGCGRAKSTVLDLAYEEFCLHTDLGEAIEPDAFAAQFPEVSQSLARILTVHRYLAANPDFGPCMPRAWPEIGDEFLGFELQEELGRGAFSPCFWHLKSP